MFKNKTLWITGASSGIGEALVLNLAKKNARIIISSRRPEALEIVREKCGENKKNVILQPLDLGDPDNVASVADDVLTKFDSLDYVFHNGGISQRSYIQNTEMDTYRKLMEVNYFGTIGLTQKILRYFLKQGHGHFVVISSLTGIFGFPLRSGYSASKHALHGYFDTLRAEHAKNNIHVTMVCPGFIKTSISLNALDEKGKPAGIMDQSTNKGLTAEKCARKILAAAAQRKKEVYIGKKEILMIYFKRYLPFVYYKLASIVKPN